MELEQARKRAEELRVIIERNNRLYYDQDAPELEDFEYDALTRELKALEAEFPQLVTANSPTQKVQYVPCLLCASFNGLSILFSSLVKLKNGATMSTSLL